MSEQTRRGRRLLVTGLALLAAGGLFSGFGKNAAIGLRIDWQSTGSDIEIRYVRMAGGHNERETQTFVSKKTSAHLVYQPADADGIPDWIEVEWLYGIVDAPTYELEHRTAKPARARFDLNIILPPAVRADVLRDRDRQQLQLIFTFHDDQLTLRCAVHQWRP